MPDDKEEIRPGINTSDEASDCTKINNHVVPDAFASTKFTTPTILLAVVGSVKNHYNSSHSRRCTKRIFTYYRSIYVKIYNCKKQRRQTRFYNGARCKLVSSFCYVEVT